VNSIWKNKLLWTKVDLKNVDYAISVVQNLKEAKHFISKAEYKF